MESNALLEICKSLVVPFITTNTTGAVAFGSIGMTAGILEHILQQPQILKFAWGGIVLTGVGGLAYKFYTQRTIEQQKERTKQKAIEQFLEKCEEIRPNHDNTCCICWENKVVVKFSPCEHAIVCSECMAKITKPFCPMCNSRIAEITVSENLANDYCKKEVTLECDGL